MRHNCLYILVPARRSVAQPGRVLASGARGPGFESPHSDHFYFERHMDYVVDLFLSNHYLKMFLYVFFYLPSKNFIFFIFSATSLFALTVYSIYKLKNPERAKEQHKRFAFRAFAYALIISIAFCIQEQSTNSFIASLVVSVIFLGGYHLITHLLKKKIKSPLIVATVFLFIILCWGTGIHYSQFKAWTWCAKSEDELTFSRSTNSPPPYSAIAKLLGIPKRNGLCEKRE